jgi:hypothetical protein
MVTTRRSSFGVQDGDTLALRSKTAPTSINTTQSKKRKEYAVSVDLSSRKKRKSFGNDGADEAMEEQMQEPNDDGNLLAEPASGSAEMSMAPPILDASNGRAVEPGTWLEDDLVPLSPEEPVRRSDAAQVQDVADPAEDAKSSYYNVRQDEENLTTVNGSTSDPAKSETQNTSQDLNDNADLKSSSQIANPLVHKRFGSEEPVSMDDEVADAGLQEDERDDADANANRDYASAVSSEDEAPEVVGSKSITKNARPILKAPKRAKKKGKPSTDIKDRIADDDKRTRPDEDPFIVDSLPEKISTTTRDLAIGVPGHLGIRASTGSNRQPSKKHKLFDKSERKPKDIIKDGVTYRKVSDPQSMALASKRHKVSNLPPKSNSNSWRLKKQVMARKRVQHVWGGRSAFLRSRRD